MAYIKNIEEETLANDNFRKVIYTDPRLQLVLMSLLPGEDIGMESHQLDQFIRIEKGTGRAILDGVENMLEDGSVIIVPKGTEHNIINTSATDKMKLYTVYAPANHAPGTIHKTKADAEAAEEHYTPTT